jgi:hypothetical protein
MRVRLLCGRGTPTKLSRRELLSKKERSNEGTSFATAGLDAGAELRFHALAKEARTIQASAKSGSCTVIAVMTRK